MTRAVTPFAPSFIAISTKGNLSPVAVDEVGETNAAFPILPSGVIVVDSFRVVRRRPIFAITRI
jgi:hypothetical protein